ncbi:hypothetical protein BAUCODRAFT_30940 [Baudoinia panamericana UAMH 10762]|uniref:Uncharacterized protein n=1 Tax=Baudoinia panamericana (strain UAMH 10762) TaxID=717646 RepID=M2MPJ7_BAUPA|nr:uncharacterized protein BAUCODRAFT_30940 [Baudoinia panamericana UAMH 10762]EMC98671.1 hypothetical protein BAUCODRAFT_30940 [Baudoinia panamericana UAMH 10762]
MSTKNCVRVYAGFGLVDRRFSRTLLVVLVLRSLFGDRHPLAPAFPEESGTSASTVLCLSGDRSIQHATCCIKSCSRRPAPDSDASAIGSADRNAGGAVGCMWLLKARRATQNEPPENLRIDSICICIAVNTLRFDPTLAATGTTCSSSHRETELRICNEERSCNAGSKLCVLAIPYHPNRPT